MVSGSYVVAQGCSAGGDTNELGGGGTTPTTATGGSGGQLFGGFGGQAGGIITEGGAGGEGGGTINPCGSECGDEELCDSQHAGIDDDCDNIVDEECTCNPGTAQACFKGDPSWLAYEGCFPGTQHCSESGIWDECTGGVHAEDHCWENNTSCHAISSYPFLTVDLKEGTGNFSDDATSESWTVDCPPGVSPCPTTQGQFYVPLQSGEYTVHYTKDTATGSDSCDYPLFVGAPGLRVELEWEHGVEGDSDTGVDVDLHLHKPGDYTSAWGGTTGNNVDCAYSNCVVNSYGGPTIANWFTGVAPPDPVNWYLDPTFEKNTCYFAPRGKGQLWQNLGTGCRNPRLDLDNITCDPTSTSVSDTDFCAPENINIDFPPKNQWIRVGVHYFSDHSKTYDVHPRIRIFCDAALIAELGNDGNWGSLGPSGYNEPVTFTPDDGSVRFWLVADVRFSDDVCATQACEVVPLYANKTQQTALLSTADMVEGGFGPPVPED